MKNEIGHLYSTYGRVKKCLQDWLENLKIIEHLGDARVDWRKILKFILEKWDERVWNGFIWFRTGSSFGHCEDGDETSVLIRCKFLTRLMECCFLKRDSVSWISLVMEKGSYSDNSCVCCGLLTVNFVVTVSSHQSIPTVHGAVGNYR